MQNRHFLEPPHVVLLTLYARVVIVDRLHVATEKQLLVPLNQAGVKGTQMRILVVYTGRRRLHKIMKALLQLAMFTN